MRSAHCAQSQPDIYQPANRSCRTPARSRLEGISVHQRHDLRAQVLHAVQQLVDAGLLHDAAAAAVQVVLARQVPAMGWDGVGGPAGRSAAVEAARSGKAARGEQHPRRRGVPCSCCRAGKALLAGQALWLLGTGQSGDGGCGRPCRTCCDRVYARLGTATQAWAQPCCVCAPQDGGGLHQVAVGVMVAATGSGTRARGRTTRHEIAASMRRARACAQEAGARAVGGWRQGAAGARRRRRQLRSSGPGHSRSPAHRGHWPKL